MVDFTQTQAQQAGIASGSPVSPKSPTTQLLKPTQTPLSPSIYSRNTDGFSILPNDSVMSFSNPPEQERINNGGSAVILTSRSVRSYVIGTPSPNRPSSTRSSRDWKAWLSHEVSGIETTNQEELTIHEQYTTPSGPHRNDVAQTVRTSHTGSEDTTVIVRESYEAPTPRPQSGKPETVSEHDTFSQIDETTSPEEPSSGTRHPPAITPLDETSDLDTSKNASVSDITYAAKVEHELESTSPTVSTPRVHNNRTISTPKSSSSASQPPLSTPKSARMNDRFPFLNTGRRSGSDFSSRSHQSKSPTSSVGSSRNSPRTTPGPKAVYSDVSAPATSSTTHQIPNTAVRKTEASQRSKENITPPPLSDQNRSQTSPIGLVTFSESIQPLSSTVLNPNSTGITQYTANTTDGDQSKHKSSPANTPMARPCLRATIRPLSPEKLARRPRSAFDLRNTPSPRPASEFRRPVLHLKTSSRSMTRNLEPNLGKDSESRGIMNGSDDRDGSVTPGQRMAERFLKERKSATVLERGVRKSASKFVREDTPAFL